MTFPCRAFACISIAFSCFDSRRPTKRFFNIDEVVEAVLLGSNIEDEDIEDDIVQEHDDQFISYSSGDEVRVDEPDEDSIDVVDPAEAHYDGCDHWPEVSQVKSTGEL